MIAARTTTGMIEFKRSEWDALRCALLAQAVARTRSRYWSRRYAFVLRKVRRAMANRRDQP